MTERMTDEALAELLAKAEAIPTGPGLSITVSTTGGPQCTRDVLAYISASQPVAVAALIREVQQHRTQAREMEARAERLRETVRQRETAELAALAEADELRAQAREARDAALEEAVAECEVERGRAVSDAEHHRAFGDEDRAGLCDRDAKVAKRLRDRITALKSKRND